MVSVIPSAVIGLTNDDAPSLAVAPSGRTKHPEASTARNCEYIAPPAIATVLPMRAWAAEDDPAATTVPAPSFPTGSDLSSRAESAPRAACPTEAVTMGRSGVPATVAVVMSALAMRRPKSDGLIGEASTRTNTSLAPGAGTGTSCSESSSVPSDNLEDGGPGRLGLLRHSADRLLKSITFDRAVDFHQEAKLPVRAGVTRFLRKPVRRTVRASAATPGHQVPSD